MTETAPIRQREGSALDRYCLCESFARVTERAALAGARWLGRADQEGAERDSAEAMRPTKRLKTFAIRCITTA